jgi:hypothetical protein
MFARIIRRPSAALVAGVTLSLCSGAAVANPAYPTKPISMIVCRWQRRRCSPHYSRANGSRTGPVDRD